MRGGGRGALKGELRSRSRRLKFNGSGGGGETSIGVWGGEGVVKLRCSLFFFFSFTVWMHCYETYVVTDTLVYFNGYILTGVIQRAQRPLWTSAYVHEWIRVFVVRWEVRMPSMFLTRATL